MVSRGFEQGCLMTLRAIVVAVACVLPTSGTAASLERVFELLAIPQMVDVMRSEGLDYARDLATDMRSGGADSSWNAVLNRIYDAPTMEETVQRGMSSILEGQDLSSIVAFFDDGVGAHVVELEISARRAMVDDGIDAAARDQFRDLTASNELRMRHLERFVQANDLIDTNVAGNLNSSIQFYFGMADAGGIALTETDILQLVWESEPDTRTETVEWVFSFLLMAYAPLSSDDLRSYIEFSETETGQILNRALFEGYNQMFNDISYNLGFALAQEMDATDL